MRKFKAPYGPGKFFEGGIYKRRESLVSKEIHNSKDRGVKIHLHPFVSGNFVESEHKNFNNEFNLRFYLPSKKKKIKGKVEKHNKLFIFLNGFAEGNTNFWDALGISLASKGVPAVLLPLPGHFCRNLFYNINDYNENDSFILNKSIMDMRLFTNIMKQSLIEDPQLLLNFNRQIIGDIFRLSENIKRQGFNLDFFQNNFSKFFIPIITFNSTYYSKKCW